MAYGSRVLSKAERNYCTTRKELLAVVHFVHYFKHYLLGKRFLLRTDHGSLRWLFNFKEPGGRQPDGFRDWGATSSTLNTGRDGNTPMPTLSPGYPAVSAGVPGRQTKNVI